MSSNFERLSQLTKIMISSAPVTAETLDSASYLGLSCTIKEVRVPAGQKQDIDVTTLYVCVEQENITVLVPRQEFSMSGNFTSMLPKTRCAVPMTMTPRMALKFSIRKRTYLYGRGASAYLVCRNQWCCGCNVFLRLKGKPVLTTEPLKVKVDLNSTLQVYCRSETRNGG